MWGHDGKTIWKDDDDEVSSCLLVFWVSLSSCTLGLALCLVIVTPSFLFFAYIEASRLVWGVVKTEEGRRGGVGGEGGGVMSV